MQIIMSGYASISIHALLAESDRQNPGEHYVAFRFLSTLSLRRATPPSPPKARVLKNFYPRSPCGERQFHIRTSTPRITFLSTLSLRRATRRSASIWLDRYFYPRSPCGERRSAGTMATSAGTFLSTLSLRRATFDRDQQNGDRPDFYPRSPCGERPSGSL